MLLAIFFDLSRIASLGAIFYLIMDMAIHWGVLTRLRKEIGANPIILVIALLLDATILAAFCWSKGTSDPLILVFAGVGLLAIFGGEWLYLRGRGDEGDAEVA